MRVIIPIALSLLLLIPLVYGSCPPLQFTPAAKIIDSKIYVVPGTRVTAPDCTYIVHTCSNTAGYTKSYPHYLTITGSANVDFFLITVSEENITVTKENVLNAIKAHTYNNITFEEVAPFNLTLEDIPSLDDIQGVPPFTVDCSKYTSSTSVKVTYVSELEVRVHLAVENFATRVNNTINVTTNVTHEDDIVRNETLITRITVNLTSPSTAYDKLIVVTTITNITNVTNITSGESQIEESETSTTNYHYVNYERIFNKFYDDGNIKGRVYTEICGVTADIHATRVTTYTFAEAGTYYIYGSFGYKIMVK
ncbi:MAG: hypothetical protein QMD14_01005 [Candidatus Aenigmarchaeota archaeon]|nr:hypothetical protein [Candidatus Aenigmarchaeota archaeon]